MGFESRRSTGVFSWMYSIGLFVIPQQENTKLDYYTGLKTSGTKWRVSIPTTSRQWDAMNTAIGSWSHGFRMSVWQLYNFAVQLRFNYDQGCFILGIFGIFDSCTKLLQCNLVRRVASRSLFMSSCHTEVLEQSSKTIALLTGPGWLLSDWWDLAFP